MRMFREIERQDDDELEAWMADLPRLRRWRREGPQPDGYDDLAMRKAVLEPLMGPMRDPRRETSRRAIDLADRWRRRAVSLHLAGWPATRRNHVGPIDVAGLDDYGREPSGCRPVGNLMAAVNCRPPFFAPAGGGRLCRLVTICPHCWAHRVAQVWKGRDANLFPASRRPSPAKPHEFVVISVEVPLVVPPTLADGRPGLEAVIAMRCNVGGRRVRSRLGTRRADHASLVAAGCLGGLESLAIDFADGAWRIWLRQLLVADAASADAVARRSRNVLPPSLWAASSAVQSVPDRRAFATLVGRTLAYPTTMMTCLPEVAVAALEARGSRHLWATFGAFRGRERIVESDSRRALAVAAKEVKRGLIRPKGRRENGAIECLD